MVAAYREEPRDEVDTLLASIRPGEVRAVFAESAAAAMARLQAHASVTSRPTVVHRWRQLPDVHAVVDEIVAAVARAALDAWPDWYPGAPSAFRLGHGSEAVVLNRAALRAVLGSREGVNAAWLRAAVARCADGRAPLLSEFSAATQVRQLCAAISEDGPIIAMVLDADAEGEERIHPPPPRASRVRAFANAAAWLAKEANARLVAILPEGLAGNLALDSITYGACNLAGGAASGPPTNEDRPVTTVWPILGRPHPASEGECVLAKRLAADAELRGLFNFNRRIGTVRNTTHLVDLVWPDGGVIVEVDGWGHRTPRNFRSDRHRDYELLISGYVVLRLPHEQVVEDPTVALEKIRDVVRFCRRERNKAAPRIAQGAT